MNLTLGSFVPLAMFIHILDYFLFSVLLLFPLFLFLLLTTLAAFCNLTTPKFNLTIYGIFEPIIEPLYLGILFALDDIFGTEYDVVRL